MSTNSKSSRYLSDLQTAEQLFQAGNYHAAFPYYQNILQTADSDLDPADKNLITQRLGAIKPDRVELVLGIITLLVVILAYVWSRVATH